MLSVLRARVQSLVGELRSPKPHSLAKKKKIVKVIEGTGCLAWRRTGVPLHKELSPGV